MIFSWHYRQPSACLPVVCTNFCNRVGRGLSYPWWFIIGSKAYWGSSHNGLLFWTSGGQVARLCLLFVTFIMNADLVENWHKRIVYAEDLAWPCIVVFCHHRGLEGSSLILPSHLRRLMIYQSLVRVCSVLSRIIVARKYKPIVVELIGPIAVVVCRHLRLTSTSSLFLMTQ